MPSLSILARDCYWKGLDSRGYHSKPPSFEFYDFSPVYSICLNHSRKKIRTETNSNVCN